MRRATEVLWKTPAIAAVTVAATSPVNRILFRDQAGFGEAGTAELTLILFLTEIVFVAALVYQVLRSAWSGWKLFGAVLLAVFGLNVALTQVEAAVFLTMPAAEVASSVLGGTVHAAVVALLVVLAFRRRADDRDAAAPLVHTPWPAGRWVRSLAPSAVCYVALYFFAGSLIWPFIRDFYATQEISAFARKQYEKQGMKIYTETTVKGLTKAGDSVTAKLEGGGKTWEVTVDRVILAVGIVGNHGTHAAGGLPSPGAHPQRARQLTEHYPDTQARWQANPHLTPAPITIFGCPRPPTGTHLWP